MTERALDTGDVIQRRRCRERVLEFDHEGSAVGAAAVLWKGLPGPIYFAESCCSQDQSRKANPSKRDNCVT